MNDHSKKSKSSYLTYIFLSGVLLCVLGAFLFRTEIVSRGHGTIEAKKHTLLFAPDDAQVESITVKPGHKVNQGDVLLVLKNVTAINKLRDLEKQLLNINHLIQQNITAEEVAKITGYIPEIQNIDKLAKLKANKTEAINKIQDIYTKLADSKLVSQITFLSNYIKEVESQEEQLNVDKLIQWSQSNMEALKKSTHLQNRQHLENTRNHLIQEIQRHQQLVDNLTIKAPFSGIVTETYVEYISELAKKGQPLLRIDNTSEGFRVIATINERNIDLIKKDMEVRMKSKVFKSEVVGYIHGKVDRIIRPYSYHSTQVNDGSFEIWIELISYPGTPVPATGVEVEVIIGSDNIINVLLGRPDKTEGKS